MRLARIALLSLLCLPLMGQQYNIPFNPSGDAPMFKSVWFCKTPDTLLTTAGTEYFAVMGCMNTLMSTTLNQHEGVVSLGGTLTDMIVNLEADIGGNNDDAIFTLMINGSPSNLTCTVEGGGGTQTTCDDLNENVTVSVGDRLAIRVETITCPCGGQTASVSIAYETATANASILIGHTGATVVSNQNLSIMGSDGSEDEGNWAEIALIAPTDGTFRNLHVKLASPLTNSGATQTFAIDEDGTASSVTCQIAVDSGAPGDQECSDTSNTLTVVAGNQYTISSDVSGTPGLQPNAYGITFIATTAGEFILAAASDNAPDPLTVEFMAITAGDGTWDTDNGDVSEVILAINAKALYAAVSVVPGASPNAWDFTLSKDATDTALTCNIGTAATACNLTGQSIAYNGTSEVISIELTPTSDPDDFVWANWAIAAEVP